MPEEGQELDITLGRERGSTNDTISTPSEFAKPAIIGEEEDEFKKHNEAAIDRTNLEETINKTRGLNKPNWKQKLVGLFGAGAIAGGAVAAVDKGLLNEAEAMDSTPNKAEHQEKMEHNEFFGKPLVDAQLQLEDGSFFNAPGVKPDQKTLEAIPQHYGIKSKDGQNVLAYESPDTTAKPLSLALEENALGQPVIGMPYGEDEKFGKIRIDNTENGAYIQYTLKVDGKSQDVFIPADKVFAKSSNPTIDATDLN